MRDLTKMLGQQVYRPARKGVAQLAWVVLHRLGQGGLEVRVGLGRPAGALAWIVAEIVSNCRWALNFSNKDGFLGGGD